MKNILSFLMVVCFSVPTYAQGPGGGGRNGILEEFVNGDGETSSSGACSSADAVLHDNNGVIGCPKLTDVAPQGLLMRPQPALASGTQTAANLVLAGGQDETTIAIDGADPSVTCADDNDTVTVTVIDSNGTSTSTVLTEGSEWTASASVADTCASLATGVSAVSGVSATCTSPNVLITLDADTAKVTLAESTAGCTTVATGTQGIVQLPGEMSITGTTEPYLTITDGTADNMTLESGAKLYIEDGDSDAFIQFGTTGAVNQGIYFGDEEDANVGKIDYDHNTDLLDFGAGAATTVLRVASTYVGVNKFLRSVSGEIDIGAACTSVSSNTGTDDICMTGVFEFQQGLVIADPTPGTTLTTTTATQTLTFPGGGGAGSQATSGLIPAGANVRGVLSEVTTGGSACTSIDIGDGTDQDMFANNSGISLGTKTTTADATAQYGMSPATAAKDVTVTANGGNCRDLVIDISVFYDTTAIP